ncbi:MAG TPA: biotin-dependent carboxyltransferase family protein [Stellaceae bacterium]|nr:biotin-dependent carboxyltransferase family protein [Stellaceae bacterium]
MTPGLKVLAPGLHTTVQDLGRFGYQNIGVPVSGALDRFGLRLANVLVGNPQGLAALEILISGPTLEIATETARVALTGAGASLGIRGETPRVVAAGQSVTLRRGDIVQIALGRQSACCYLGVERGIAVPRVLGSASTYVRATLGGLNGRALQRDDLVPLAIGCASARGELRAPVSPAASADQPIRVVLGPQHKYFRKEALAALLDAEFRVSKDTDRMGMRLDGPLLRHRRGWDIVSDAIATGSIQVPGSGQPIVLLADHQTTGGYPKIATVISADLPALGRCRPGDPLRFVAVEFEAAEELCREAEREFAKLAAALEPVPNDNGIDVGSLYGENLISGVTTGFE